MFTQFTDRIKACLFFGIVFGLTLCISLLAPVLGDTAMFLHMLTPTLATILMLLVVTRDGYTGTSWRALGLQRAGLQQWILALAVPLVVMSVVYGIVWSSPIARAALPARFALNDLPINIAIDLLITTILALSEEIGFRGYLLPKLMPLGTTRALLLSGLLHGLWHFPLLLLTPFYPIQGNWLIIGPVILSTLTAAGVFYGFLFLKSRSIWPSTLAHGAINTCLNWFGLFTVALMPGPLEYLAGETGLLTMIATASVAALILYRLRAYSGFDSALQIREEAPVV